MKTIMNKSSYLLIAIFAGFFLAACSNERNSSVREEARQSLNVQDNSTPELPDIAVPPTDASATTPPAQNINPNVPHYICPDDCEGSGGPGAGTCPTCGKDYVHNAAYHQPPPGGTTTASGTTPAGGEISTTTTNPTPAPTRTPEPAQNAAGVWHYTCPSGCEGGAGSAIACAGCGGTLAHNAAYHQ